MQNSIYTQVFANIFTHEDLLSRGEVYASMWLQQQTKADADEEETTDDSGASGLENS